MTKGLSINEAVLITTNLYVARYISIVRANTTEKQFYFLVLLSIENTSIKKGKKTWIEPHEVHSVTLANYGTALMG